MCTQKVKSIHKQIPRRNEGFIQDLGKVVTLQKFNSFPTSQQQAIGKRIFKKTIPFITVYKNEIAKEYVNER